MSKNNEFVILVDDAILHARLNKKTINGEKITKYSLAKALKEWDNENYKALNNNIHNFSRGNTGAKFVRIIRKICEITGVDANYLLNVKPMSNENKQI